MKYIYIPKVYNSLRISNRVNNQPQGAGANLNKTLARGIRISPSIGLGNSNQISFSFCIRPAFFSELLRLYSVATGAMAQNIAILDGSILTTGIGFSFTAGRSDGPTLSSININNSLADTEKWVTVLFTIDAVPATKTMSLYINGYLFRTVTTTTSFNYTSSFLESYFLTSFIGTIRSFQIWNSFFNSTEALSLHNSALARQESSFPTIFSSKNLRQGFIFESNKITKGTNSIDISLNDWTTPASDPPALSITATTTSGNTTISGITSTTAIKVGMVVFGSGIQSATRVTSVAANSIVVSKAPTASATVSLNFYPRNIWKLGSFYSSITGGNTLYISCDDGATAGYVDGTAASYVYKDIAVTSSASILSLKCFLPRENSSSDFFKILISNTSFAPVNDTEYNASLPNGGSYGNANILKQSMNFVYDGYGGHGRPNDEKTINYDLSDYEGQTVRVILCFRADISLNSIDGTAGPVAVLSAKMIEKSTIEGIISRDSLGQLIPNGDFEQGTTNWNFANQTNAWVIGPADKLYRNRALYISSDNGLSSAYNSSSTSTSHAWTNLTLSDSNPRIKFVVKVGGESSFDYLKIRVVSDPNNSFSASGLASPVAGTLAISGTSIHDQNINLTSGWTLYEINLTGLFLQTFGVRLVFTWVNDSGGGTQPGAVIDGVSVSNNSNVSMGPYEPITLPMIFNFMEFTDDAP